MPQVFACLAIANILLLTATGAMGLFAERFSTDRHVLLAVLTLLISCLIQVVAFTYLTVTGKMVGQAVHIARLEPEILTSVKTLKRKLTHALAVVFLSIVLVTASGASSWRSGAATLWHDLASGVSFFAHIGALWFQYEIVVANASLVSKALDAYSKAVRK